MELIRKVRMMLIGQPIIEGAGVHLRRVFGFSESPKLDPFMMFDDFRSDRLSITLSALPGTCIVEMRQLHVYLQAM